MAALNSKVSSQSKKDICATPASQFVSVIVPVLNHPERLKSCLDALQHQVYPADAFEVIVVDNGSDEDVKSVVSEYPEMIYEREAFPTSYAARNRGIARSRGSVLAFTDSDCIPSPDWIETGVRALLQNPGCGVVAGAVRFFFRDAAKPTAVEIYSSLTSIPQERLVKFGNFAATANLFTFRDVMEKFGPFDAAFKSSGDVEWSRRVSNGGLELLYRDHVVVRHPACSSLGELYRRIVRIEGGFFDLSCKQPSSYGSPKYLVRKMLPSKWLLKEIMTASGVSPLRKARVLLITGIAKAMRISEYLRLQITGQSRQFRR